MASEDPNVRGGSIEFEIMVELGSGQMNHRLHSVRNEEIVFFLD